MAVAEWDDGDDGFPRAVVDEEANYLPSVAPPAVPVEPPSGPGNAPGGGESLEQEDYLEPRTSGEWR